MSNLWKHYYPDHFKVAPSRRPSNTSAPVSSTSASPIFQQTTNTSNVSLQHLCADVKAILQSVEASLEEQKKLSKDLNDLGTAVNVLEGVLCGNAGDKNKGENRDLDTLQPEGGIVRRLATMDGTINDLLARVSGLDTASRHPVVCCNVDTTARTPPPPLQKEYLDTSTGTDEPLTPTAPPSFRLKVQPWFPSAQHSPKMLAPASWNTNRNNPYRTPAFARSQGYIHSVQRDSSLSGSTESRASPEFTMSSGVFDYASSPAIVAGSAAPTFHTGVPADGPDLSSPFPTPSPETSIEESFSRTNDSNSRSRTAPQPRWDGPGQNMSTISHRAFPSSLLNPIPLSSTNPVHKPARTSLLSAFRSLDSRSNPAPSHFSTLPSTSSTSGSSNHNASSPASRIAPNPPSSLPSSSAHTVNMHLASPPPTPTSTLTQAHATASCHILPKVYKDIGGDVDCEGPCADCEMRHYEHYGCRNQGTDFQEQSAEETRDQSTLVSSSRVCLNTSSGEIGTPSPSLSEASAPEAQPEVPRVPLSMFETQNQSTVVDPSCMCFDTSSGELDHPSTSLGANAEASPHLDKQLEGPGVEKEVPISAFEVQDQMTIIDSQRMRLDRPCGELDHPSRSFEVNAEAYPHVHEAQLEGLGIEPEVPPPASEAHPEKSGGEPKSTQLAPRARSKSFLSHVIDLDVLQRLIHGHELPLLHGLGAARIHEDGEHRGSGHSWTDECRDVNRDFGGPGLEESLRLGHTPDTGGSGELGLDCLHEPGYDDSGECERGQSLQIEHNRSGFDGTLEESFKSAEERSDVSLTLNDTPKPLAADTRDTCPREEKPADSEDSVQPEPVLSDLRQATPSDLTYPNADYLDQYEDLRVEDSREQTPADSLFRDEEAVAAALTAPSPSTESESPPLPSSLEGLSRRLPLQPESDALCLGVQAQGDGAPSQESTEILADGDDIFTTFIDFMNAYTDGATSALRSTYTEELVEQEPGEMHVEHEPAVTIDHEIHIKSKTTISAELSAPLEHAGSVHSPPTFTTSPPHALQSSLSYPCGSLSPLSSLGDTPPLLQEGQGEIGVELHRTENLDSNKDLAVSQCRAYAESSASVPQSKTPLKSLQSGASGGASGASIEELSILAKKDPRKIMVSELKRKLEPLESTIQSQPSKKKTRFNADMDATSSNTDGVTSSFTYLAHQLRYQGAGDPMPQSSDPSESAEDAISLQVESISAPMEVDSASAIGTTTIIEPAQISVITSEMKESEPAANSSEPWEDSVSRGRRARPPSRKASQATDQKNVQQSERNRKSKSQRPQKRQSRSLAVQEEAQMCQWPAKSEQDGSFQRQFVQCDNCDLWYHFVCVGISEGDPRLEEPDSVFICPPCCVSSARRQTMRKRAAACARPDCSLTQLDAEEFVIERLVGRKTVGEAGYMFLVKWEGYPIAQASWVPEGNISGVSQVFDRFVADAMAEGINLDLKGTVLLEEARHGGWKI